MLERNDLFWAIKIQIGNFFIEVLESITHFFWSSIASKRMKNGYMRRKSILQTKFWKNVQILIKQ